MSICLCCRYTGVAWATLTDFKKDRVKLIMSWPGTGREEGKVPTEIWYSDDGTASWGYEIPANVEPFRWFKLLLLKREDLGDNVHSSEILTRGRAKLAESGKTATDLVADYLRHLWTHDFLEALPIQIIITVPAIWKGYARQAMRDAAARAGLLDTRLAGATELTLAPEPEVAALATLIEQGSGVLPDQAYLICDAGGGTVDLISYEVKSLTPMILHEAVEGKGGLCGGIFIDQAFERACRSRLGAKWERISKVGLRDIMRKEWEHGVKSEFKPGRAGKEYVIALPAEVFRRGDPLDDMERLPHIKKGRIHFLESHIQAMFEATFHEINELVEGQIQKAKAKGLSVIGIILVGGLGCSPYLYDYLEDKHSGAGITILQSGGIKPRTAICRGAVMKGFMGQQSNDPGLEPPIMISSRVSRASYGIRFHTKYDPSLHPESERYYDEHLGEYRGQSVRDIEPVRFSWYQLFEEHEYLGTLKNRIYYCYDEVPPSRTSPSVGELGTIRCNLDAQYSELENFWSKTGKWIKIVRYDIELIPSGDSVEFVTYVGERKMGGKRVTLEYK
ncbi:hypothetical protein F5Y17DRAFT_466864 [Xylariaceae sp. FL0594]|nr:hypothetical protein F5Y17DRAFT_466864 [Xylariaceae sp. FL0594]